MSRTRWLKESLEEAKHKRELLQGYRARAGGARHVPVAPSTPRKISRSGKKSVKND